MKFTMILLANLISASAFACPQIAGTYTCNAGAEVSTLVVTQGVQNGVPYYDLRGEFLVMDSQGYHFEDDGMTGYTAARCSGNVIEIQTVADLLNQGRKAGEMNTLSTLTASGNNFALITNGAVNYYGQVSPINEAIICIRQ